MPAMKVACPLATPVTGAATFTLAVKVTDWADVRAVRAVVVIFAVTRWVTALLLARAFALPL